MVIKVRKMIEKIVSDGWYLINQEGSHRQFKHPVKKGKVTISGHLSDDLHPKTAKSILTQAGLVS